MRIVGPSYTLNDREADVQRSVNLMPVINETPTGKGVAYLDSVPGLREFSPGATATGALLLEDGMYLLLESGAFTLLE